MRGSYSEKCGERRQAATRAPEKGAVGLHIWGRVYRCNAPYSACASLACRRHNRTRLAHSSQRCPRESHIIVLEEIHPA
eukprot:4546299-Pyramimonas_sp.AAC.1